MDFEKLVEMRNRENPFAAFLGITVTKIEEGFAQAEMMVRPEFLNPVQVAHGGCLYTLADVAVGSAAASFGTKAVTLSGEYHYLSTAKNAEKLIATAKCLRAGNSVQSFDVFVRTEDGTLVGKATFTSYRLKKELITFD